MSTTMVVAAEAGDELTAAIRREHEAEGERVAKCQSDTKNGCAENCTTAKRNAENRAVIQTEQNTVVEKMPQPQNLTGVRERWIQYDRDHSRIEHSYRVFKGSLRHHGKCRVCGDPFWCAQPSGKYCSGRCANDAAIAARREARAEHRAALVCSCGATIAPGKAGRLPRYCSAACRQRAYRTRKAEVPA